MYISNKDYQLIEQFIYLPLVITILHRDKQLIEKAPFKIKEPYLHLINYSLQQVETDLYSIKQQMKKKQIKVTKKGANDAFTLYEFNIKGQIQEHSFYHPVMKNKTSNLLDYYFLPHPTTS